MFHDPLVRSPFLPSVTAVIAETPGTVHQHLLRENLQGARLRDKNIITHRLVTFLLCTNHLLWKTKRMVSLALASYCTAQTSEVKLNEINNWLNKTPNQGRKLVMRKKRRQKNMSRWWETVQLIMNIFTPAVIYKLLGRRCEITKKSM